MKKTILTRFFVSFVLALGATALSAQTHWSYTGTYQNEMRIFFELKDRNGTVGLDNYEIAAFIGGKCRGVAEKQSHVVSAEQTIYYGRLQLWGDAATETGAAITFKAYDKTTHDELDVTTEPAITFADNVQLGTISALKQFTLNILYGDVNNDGYVKADDIVCILNYIVGKPNTTFIKAAADVNEDRNIDIADAVSIVNIITAE